MIHPNKVTMFIDNRLVTVHADDGTSRYARIIELLGANQYEQAADLALEEIRKLQKVVQIEVDGVKVELRHGIVFINGVANDSSVAGNIKQAFDKGLPVEALMKFLARLNKNPSFRARRDLFDWIQNHEMPITHDGKFIAFKVVRDDGWDIYTGRTFQHHIGAEIAVDRTQVNDDPTVHCGEGAHFCGESYLSVYGSHKRETDKIVILEVSPEAVVSFPTDGNYGKGRATGYRIIGEMTRDEAAQYMGDRQKVYWCE